MIPIALYHSGVKNVQFDQCVPPVTGQANFNHLKGDPNIACLRVALSSTFLLRVAAVAVTVLARTVDLYECLTWPSDSIETAVHISFRGAETH